MNPNTEAGLVSIIVPVYNVENELNRCVDSLLSQTYGSIEILLVDDGSKDKSLDICRQYEKIDSRVRVFSHENRGVSYTRNRGMESANGEYIMFVDSDDYVDKTICEECVKAIEKEGAALALCGYYIRFHNKGGYHEDKIEIPLLRPLTVEAKAKAYASLIDNRVFLSVCTKIYRKSVLSSGNIRFDIKRKLGEDMLFNQQYLGAAFDFVMIDKCLYYYEVKEKGSLTSSSDLDRKENGEYLFQKSEEFAERMGIAHYIMPDISKYYFKSCMVNIESQIGSYGYAKVRPLLQGILKSGTSREALKYKKPGDKEFNIYKIVFNTKSPLLLYLFAHARSSFKKLVRR